MRKLIGALLLLAATSAAAQSITIPLLPSEWVATDSIRFEAYLGRPSVYIDRGAAIARNARMRNGTFEFDMAGSTRSNFMGAAFHATAPDNAEIIFFRLGSSGTNEAIQYGPALNGVGAAWQVYHGDGANATAVLPRGEWIRVRITISGDSASVFLNDAAKPVLVVPYLAGVDGGSLGIWTGGFGRGAHFSNMRYSPDIRPIAQTPAPSLPAGTIADWQLSEAIDGSAFVHQTLPRLSSMTWQNVHAEHGGIVLVNRYRRAALAGLPSDASQSLVVDSVMNGRVPGTKVVFARSSIESDRDGVRRMHFGYSDGVVIYCNGQPLYFGMNAPFFRDLGVMDRYGDAVYLPLKRGTNEIVLAVTEYSGGWAFWARLDP
jgi:hypothetical protein